MFNSALLNFEEIYTLLPQTEICLNFRSITASWSDLADLNTSTPVHSLVEGPNHKFLEPAQLNTSSCVNQRWHLQQKHCQHFP